MVARIAQGVEHVTGGRQTDARIIVALNSIEA